MKLEFKKIPTPLFHLPSTPESLEHIRHALIQNLDSQLPFLKQILPAFFEMDRLSLHSHMVLAATESLGKPLSQESYDLACVIEYLRMASELHTHILETSEFRRKKAEFESLWGNEISILLGDYLLSVAFQTLTRLGNLDVLQWVSRTTASIARGQILEISQPSRPTVQDWEVMACQKYAELVGAAARSVGRFQDQDASVLDELDAFGQKVALCFVLLQEKQLLSQKDSLENALHWNMNRFMVYVTLQNTAHSQLLDAWQNQQWDVFHGQFMDVICDTSAVEAAIQQQMQHYYEHAQKHLETLPLTHSEPLQNLLKAVHYDL